MHDDGIEKKVLSCYFNFVTLNHIYQYRQTSRMRYSIFSDIQDIGRHHYDVGLM